MPKSRVQRVNITVQPVPGNEPDAFEVEFHGSDGSRSCGQELELPAGKLGMWKITTTASETITAGGGFLFQRHSFLFSHRIQDYNPEGRDFVTLKAQCDAALRLVVNSEKQSHRPGFAQVLVDEGEMKTGDSFTIQIGDSSYGGAGSAVYDGTTLGRITGAVDRTGDGVYRELACNPCRIHITSNPVPALLRLLGPSIVTPDEAFALHLMAFDANHNICEQFEGRVAFSGPISAVEGLPKSISLGSSDSGLVILEDIRISEPGLIRLIAEDERHDLRAVSNPILCKEEHDRCLHSWHPDALDIDLTYADEIPLREGAYYVRLRQIDGEYAWSTPIWTFCPDGSEQYDLPRWNAHEPLDLLSLRPNQAESYEADLYRYLEVEEEIDEFHDLTPFDVIEEVTGKCALFLGYFGIDRDPISIRWYFEFDMPKIHVNWGWRDFGLRPTPPRVEERILESDTSHQRLL